MYARLLIPLALAIAVALPATASAATCEGDFLYDAEGYLWDVRPPSVADGLFESGGSNDADDAPPGPRFTTDSYDRWGGLYVGGETGANAYVADGADVCFDEDEGRELVLPEKTIDGFLVRRKIYVSATGLAGARILTLLRNPSASPRTTSVQVGDTSESDYGSLGSDDDTRLRSSSSGDEVLTTADRWAVTSDHEPGSSNDDVSLAHVFDGAGGADRIDFVTPTGDLGAEDELAYRWGRVTVPPGGTAAYLSYEIQQGVASGDGAAEDHAARGKALAYDAAPLAHVYAAMTDQEIAAVRNWPHPAPTAAFRVAEATDRAPAALDATGSTASSVPGACSALSYAWDLDGVGAAGATVRRRLAAGTHTVKLTVTNSCGASATRSATVKVADATAPAARAKASVRRGRLRVRLRSSEFATVEVVARRKGRVVGRARAVVQAGVARTVGFKVRRAGRLALTVTVTDIAGNARTLTKRV